MSGCDVWNEEGLFYSVGASLFFPLKVCQEDYRLYMG